MLIVISPAKTLDFDTPPPVLKCTMPMFLDEAQELVGCLKKLSAGELAKLMGISAKIAELNHRRYREWEKPFTISNAKQALWAFRGDVYIGLEADTFDQKDLEFAQRHLRILSGLYGVLRPLDLIQPYRLEMGTKFATSRCDNLYQFWGDTITDHFEREIERNPPPTLINLASQEYFKSVHRKNLGTQVITPIFKERRNGAYNIISFIAKRARGMMSRYIVKNRINDPVDIKQFKDGGYRYSKQLSDDANWVFIRG